MKLKKLFEIAGVDITKGKAKKLVESQSGIYVLCPDGQYAYIHGMSSIQELHKYITNELVTTWTHYKDQYAGKATQPHMQNMSPADFRREVQYYFQSNDGENWAEIPPDAVARMQQRGTQFLDAHYSDLVSEYIDDMMQEILSAE